MLSATIAIALSDTSVEKDVTGIFEEPLQHTPVLIFLIGSVCAPALFYLLVVFHPPPRKVHPLSLYNFLGPMALGSVCMWLQWSLKILAQESCYFFGTCIYTSRFLAYSKMTPIFVSLAFLQLWTDAFITGR